MTDLDNPIFNDLDKAREALELARWPNGPYCPHCGNADEDMIAKVEGKKQSHRPGLYYCNECKGQFTVTVGTVFERSKVPLTKWWLATHLMASSKKGISAHQIHRMLGVTYKTAWFMCHRIREAMKDMKPEPMGGEGKIVEADETYYRKTRNTSQAQNYAGHPYQEGGKAGGAHKRVIFGLVERGGKVRTFHVDHATAEAFASHRYERVAQVHIAHRRGPHLYRAWKRVCRPRDGQSLAEEYVRGNVHTNTLKTSGQFSSAA